MVDIAPYKILHCIGDLGVGGSERQLLQAVQFLDRERFESSVCYLYPPENLKDQFSVLGIPTVRLSSIPRKIGWLQAILGIAKTARKQRADLIHASVFPIDVMALIAGMLTRVPVVITLTSTFNRRVRAKAHKGPAINHWKSTFVLRFGYSVGRLAMLGTKNRIVAVSEAVKQSAVKDLGLPGNRIDVVYRGLLPEWFHRNGHEDWPIAATRRALGLEECYPVLLNVGRLVPLKGQDDLIKMMPFVISRYPGARLLLAGSGRFHPELEGLRERLGLQAHVMFLESQDIVTLLQLSDIFVFASHYEGLPNAVIEAQAAGKPVVGFSIPALEEVVEHGRSGILVRSRNVDEFVQAVIQLASKPNMASVLGGCGRQIVQQKFDIRQNVKRLETVYEKVLADGTK